ncbi:hypothetical protein GE061_011396 [Apolygus lucorum]|uniref:CCHC-type domain-containing protein n=1 Tax=Apolygus lucorum TaxID=248454 RepID=A0A8S9XYH7_APOLU|nr:hypothetical protein GE061_011396 [Apolygus lucorum]
MSQRDPGPSGSSQVPSSWNVPSVAVSGLGAMPNIKKLTGSENYSNCKFGMEMFLIAEDLWAVVEGTETSPKKDAKARSKICLMVDESLYPMVRSQKTAKEVWTKLESNYESKGLCRRLSLLKQLFSLDLKQFSTIEEYLNRILSISQQLDSINAGLEVEFVGVVMLKGFGEEYQPIIMALESSGAKITGDSVRTLLSQQNQPKVGDDKALILKKESKKKRFVPKCFACDKKGHFASQCKTKNKNASEQGTSMAFALTSINQNDELSGTTNSENVVISNVDLEHSEPLTDQPQVAETEIEVPVDSQSELLPEHPVDVWYETESEMSHAEPLEENLIPDSSTVELRRSSRIPKTKQWHCCVAAAGEELNEPSNYKDVLENEEKEKWLAAMKDE